MGRVYHDLDQGRDRERLDDLERSFDRDQDQIHGPDHDQGPERSNDPDHDSLSQTFDLAIAAFILLRIPLALCAYASPALFCPLQPAPQPRSAHSIS